MSFISITDILGETILQIEEQVGANEFPLIKGLHDFQRLVQRKLENHGLCPQAQDYINSMPKIDSMLEKRNQLQDKLQTLNENKKKNIEFMTDIIERNRKLSAERMEQFNEVIAAERALYKQQITLAKSTFEMRENQEYKPKIEETRKLLDRSRTTNMKIEKARRQEWLRMKNALQKILDQYDTQMIQLHNDRECLTQLQEQEECELQHYQILCQEQNKLFNDLMQEKEAYLESVRQQKLQEIRMKIAERTIVKFIEKYYPIWKLKKMKALKKKSKYKSRYRR